MCVLCLPQWGCVSALLRLFPFQIAFNIEVVSDFNIAAECVQRVWDASQQCRQCITFALLASLRMAAICTACQFANVGHSPCLQLPFLAFIPSRVLPLPARMDRGQFLIHANYNWGMCGTQCRIIAQLYNYITI